MSGLVNVLVIVAVIALVRQCSAQRISPGRRWWVLPGVLLVVALREPGIVDPRHQSLALGILVAELAVGLVTGAGWGWTARLWRESDGSLWSKGTKATAFVWVGGLALRAALYGAATGMGVHQDSSALLLALAVTLLVRGGVLALRTGGIRPAYGGPADGSPSQPAWKDRV